MFLEFGAVGPKAIASRDFFFICLAKMALDAGERRMCFIQKESLDIDPSPEDLLACWGLEDSEENLQHFFPMQAVVSGNVDRSVDAGDKASDAIARSPGEK